MAVLLVTAGRMGFNTGMVAMVARFVGAGDEEGANHVAQQSFVISTIYAVVMATIGVLFAEPILILMGLEPDVVAEGAAYLRITFIGSAAMSFGMMAEGIMQASGDAITPMRISVLYRLFHVALCPFLIFGWWIFPRTGVSGAAISNIVSQSLGMVLGLWILFTGRSRLRLTFRHFRLDLNIIWRIVRIGIPASISMMGRSLGRLGLMWFMVPYGTLAVACHTLVQRVEVFLTMPGFGFGRAASVLVGQNLGAQQPERAERSTWLAAGFAQSIITICTVAVLIWPGSVIRIFSSEPELVQVAIVYLRIGAVSFLTLGIEAVIGAALSGAGDTLPPMLVTLFRFGIQLFLAFLLPLVAGLGVYGVRWAIVIGMIAGMIAYIVYFRLGIWKRKRI